MTKQKQLKKILYIGNKLNHLGFTPTCIDTLGKQMEDIGFTMYYAGTFKNQVKRLLQIIFKTISLCRKVDYILIDTYSTNSFWYSYITGRISKIFKAKYIPILHGGSLPARLKRSKKACNRLFRNSYTNVAVSNYLSYEFGERGYETTIIPNSIDIKAFPFKLRHEALPKLLWVRSFHSHYNPNMAADVLAELIETYPDAELCMVGPDKDGSMQEFINYSTNLGLKSQIKVTGLLPKKEWIKMSGDYDFLINTTNVDNTPYSVIESMALGLCIVSTDPGGIRYFLEDSRNAQLVHPGEYKAMSERISAMIQDSDKFRQQIKIARQDAEQYDWMIVRQKWLSLLK